MVYSHRDCCGIPLEKKLDELFGKRGGFFIELGANDGVFQSNTAFLEKQRDWKGILIEPSRLGFELCQKNRPNSKCVNYACVSNSFEGEYVRGDFNTNNPMGSVDGIRRGLQKSSGLVDVKATTLEKILDEHCTQEIDFLSLDTEGYELPILEGLNLNKYRPRYMLIEIYSKDYDEIVKFLDEHRYLLHSNFTNYSKKTNPCWDGTHNDFLFIDGNL